VSEAIDRMDYTFRNMQSGEHDWPNSCEGDMLRIAYREITRLRKLTKWQPIATAPKDRTYVMTWGEGGCRVAAWCVMTGQWRCGSIVNYSPTHWMPLPSPPETNGKADDAQ